MTSFCTHNSPKRHRLQLFPFCPSRNWGQLVQHLKSVMETGTEHRLSDSRDLRAHLECFKIRQISLQPIKTTAYHVKYKLWQCDFLGKGCQLLSYRCYYSKVIGNKFYLFFFLSLGFFICKNGINWPYLIELFWSFNEIMNIKCLVQYLAYNNYSVKGSCFNAILKSSYPRLLPQSPKD